MSKSWMGSIDSIVTKAGHGELWGFDLRKCDRKVLEAIIQKYRDCSSTIPSLRDSGAKIQLAESLEWRRYSYPRRVLAKTRSFLLELGLFRITLHQGSYVMWVTIDEDTLNSSALLNSNLASSEGFVNLGITAMELLADILLGHPPSESSADDHRASCVVEFNLRDIPKSRDMKYSLRNRIRTAIAKMVSLIRSYYPSFISKAYIINPSEEYLAYLDVPERLLRETVLLQSPKDLGLHLGSQVPPEYGGFGKSLSESDCLRTFSLDSKMHDSTKEKASLSTIATENEKDGTEPLVSSGSIAQTTDDPEPEEPQLRLIYSETIGPPTIVLDPEDLEASEDLCPNKMGARLVLADSDMLVKFGHGVRLAEAEALHLVSVRTAIPAPKLLSAYILDGTGYIVMSYEAGESLESYWDHSSSTEQEDIIQQLHSYVKQLREIKGDFIGGIDESPCRDGIFEAGYGDYRQYSYGPYSSEQSFNEGMVQALRDRLHPKTLERNDDPESVFFTGEYTLYQTVRALKDHEIVFTHADLHPGNIIVRSDGTPVILDWGLAGFWPAYWEFYRAMHNPTWRRSWDRMVEKFIPPYYIEYGVMGRVFSVVWN
ncbi:kinase-like protein [Aspergillus steynii IBT 23096]|uniref:Kinase-like protein n=1 Tax=Aspergillus steynii IBT 23096 TaxID=1392250 RepID=A0A2I2FSN7_9EURO|nr:kinase-like protein [Aspergillus steynii IBT 23096]PLB43658.1 kinase-like protein [Aspergillus steynii IBT 23096]